MKILVVDDEFVALTKMITLLSEFGECEAATNGGQALEMFMQSAFQGELYDLMTIDIEMPDINGLKVLQAICKSEENQNFRPAKKIIVSAADKRQNQVAAAEYGCEFLTKPVKREALVNKLLGMGIKKPEEAASPEA